MIFSGAQLAPRLTSEMYWISESRPLDVERFIWQPDDLIYMGKEDS